MKVLILSDGQGWVIDRFTDGIIGRMTDVHFIKRFYTKIDPEELIRLSETVDIVHYMNSDVGRLKDAIDAIKTPLIISIRSFRYPEVVKTMKPTLFNVNHPDLLKEFPNSVYVTEPINMKYEKKPFIVGMACQPTPENFIYKGVDIVKEACDELGVELALATNVPPEQMIEFYKACDLVVCASLAEGFSTIVMECMAINKPVITTNVGTPSLLNCHKVERNKESIKEMIGRFYTAPQVESYTWEAIIPQIRSMYERVLNVKT